MCKFITGSFFLLFGFSIFIELIFGIRIPVGRIAFGLLLLFIGLWIIMDRHPWEYRWNKLQSHSTCMGESHIVVDGTTINQSLYPLCYSTVFGENLIDLSSLKLEDFAGHILPIEVRVRTVFGQTLVKINKNIPVHIYARSVFGQTETPDIKNLVLGSHHYISHPGTAPMLVLNAKTVFGLVRVEAV